MASAAVAPEVQAKPRFTAAKFAGTAFAMWLGMVAVDALLNAGFFNSVYLLPSPFLRDPHALFRLIPVGYASFLLWSILLLWLAVSLGVRGAWRGLRLGAIAGACTSAGFLIGLYSVATADVRLLVVWFASQTLEGLVGGAIGGAGLAGAPTWKLVVIGFSLFLGAVLLVVTLQSFLGTRLSAPDPACASGVLSSAAYFCGETDAQADLLCPVL